MRLRLAAVALVAIALVSCSGGKKSPSSTPASLLEQSTTSTLPPTPVVAKVLSPEKGSLQGSGGRGMVVVLSFTAKDPTALIAQFRLGGSLPSPAAAVKPGHNPAFPGLIVALSTTGPALGGPSANLANLFQIVSPVKQPDGSVQVSAVWTNADAGFGIDVDVTLVAFTVAGTAPDVIPATPADLSANSNPAQVTFHLAPADDATAGVTGSTTTSAPTAAGATTTAKPTTTTVKPTTTTVAPTTTKAPTTTVAPTTTTRNLLGL